jgi:Uma2 family endonuclease
MQFPAPDFVVKILSPSTEERDRGVKYQDYAAHGVAEYWLIDPEAGTLEQYALQGDHYDLQTKARTGIVSSVAVPACEIPIRAIFDPAEHMAALQQILAAPAAPEEV